MLEETVSIQETLIHDVIVGYSRRDINCPNDPEYCLHIGFLRRV